jgi:hypothetical protein
MVIIWNSQIFNFWSTFLLPMTLLYFTLSMITICYNIKLYLMWLILMKTILAYIALEFWIQLCNFVSWIKILGNVLPRYWRCDITVFTLPLKSYSLLVIHMSGLPFPNLKLTYTPPRAKYEWKYFLYHAYTFVEFLQMLILYSLWQNHDWLFLH